LSFIIPPSLTHRCTCVVTFSTTTRFFSDSPDDDDDDEKPQPPLPNLSASSQTPRRTQEHTCKSVRLRIASVLRGEIVEQHPPEEFGDEDHLHIFNYNQGKRTMVGTMRLGESRSQSYTKA
jgi:hypothetical protein